MEAFRTTLLVSIWVAALIVMGCAIRVAQDVETIRVQAEAAMLLAKVVK